MELSADSVNLEALDDIYVAPLPEIAWDVEDIIERDTPVLLIGDSECGKSWIALHLARCIASGEPAFEKFPTRRRTRAIYLNYDAGAIALKRRAKRLTPAPNVMLASPTSYEAGQYEHVLHVHCDSFVVTDCLADVIDPDAGPDQMRDCLKGLRSLYEQTGCGGIIVDHAKRAKVGAEDAYYGTHQKKAAVRQMITVQLVQRGRDRMRVMLHCAKMSEAERFEDFLVDLLWVGESFRAVFAGWVKPPNVERTESPLGEHIRAVLDDAGDRGLGREMLLASVNERMAPRKANKNQLLEILNDYMARGLVQKFGRARATKYRIVHSARKEKAPADQTGASVAHEKEQPTDSIGRPAVTLPESPCKSSGCS